MMQQPLGMWRNSSIHIRYSTLQRLSTNQHLLHLQLSSILIEHSQFANISCSRTLLYATSKIPFVRLDGVLFQSMRVVNALDILDCTEARISNSRFIDFYYVLTYRLIKIESHSIIIEGSTFSNVPCSYGLLWGRALSATSTFHVLNSSFVDSGYPRPSFIVAIDDLFYHNVSLVVKNCKFYNLATTVTAIYPTLGHRLVVLDSHFVNCTSTLRSGAIYASRLLLRNSMFEGCNTDGVAGAILLRTLRNELVEADFYNVTVRGMTSTASPER
jgi:hypothetical protein